MKFFTRIVTLLSQAFGMFAAALTAAAVVIVCHMVFVRYVLNHNTIWQTMTTADAMRRADTTPQARETNATDRI